MKPLVTFVDGTTEVQELSLVRQLIVIGDLMHNVVVNISEE